jgi:uncharacterized membrane protein YdjX (TVP38/TMEM64 family)
MNMDHEEYSSSSTGISQSASATNYQTMGNVEQSMISHQRVDLKVEAAVEQDPEGVESQDVASSPSRRLNSAAIQRIIVGLVLVGVIIFVIVDSLTNGYVRSGFETFLTWIESNPTAGVFAFMGVYFVATVLFLPGSILTLGSGFVFANAFGLGFGVVLATVAVFFGAFAGAVAAFLIGRYLLREWVQTLTKKYPLFEAIDLALEDKGFRIMALLRLSPIIPFNALNYIAGVTAVSLLHYTLSFLAILPGTILYVFLGATAGSLTESATSGSGANTTQIVTIAVGVTFGLLGVGFTTYYAKQELRKISEAREAAEEVVDDEAAS